MFRKYTVVIWYLIEYTLLACNYSVLNLFLIWMYYWWVRIKGENHCLFIQFTSLWFIQIISLGTFLLRTAFEIMHPRKYLRTVQNIYLEWIKAFKVSITFFIMPLQCFSVPDKVPNIPCSEFDVKCHKTNLGEYGQSVSILSKRSDPHLWWNYSYLLKKLIYHLQFYIQS